MSRAERGRAPGAARTGSPGEGAPRKVTRDMDAHEYLREMVARLNRIGVEFWLDSGTLLGFIREGRILPWDHDIDLAATPAMVERAWEARDQWVPNGSGLHISKRSPQGPLGRVVVEGGPLIITLHAYHREGDWLVHYAGNCEWVAPAPLIGSPRMHESSGFRVPERSEEYLEYRYGLDWRTPLPLPEYSSNKHDRGRRHQNRCKTFRWGGLVTTRGPNP